MTRRAPNRRLRLLGALGLLVALLPAPAFAMHIAEGIIVGWPAVGYTLFALALMSIGARGINAFYRAHPERKPLIGMGAAIIFFLSLIPIPAFTGTTSHPCGTPLVSILLGPRIAIALTGISLILQAAFFAHGGFGTWGANLVALGLCGSVCGWGTFALARRAGCSILVAGCAGGFVGDVAVYGFSGLALALALVDAPNAQYGFGAYLGLIYAAYAPTQIPIAIGEMLITGLALRHALKQRPDVLAELRIWRAYAA